MRNDAKRGSPRWILPLLLALVGASGCVEDEYWIDELTVILDEPANHAVVLVHEVAEGNVADYESLLLDDETGRPLATIDEAGHHDVLLLTDTPQQRDALLLIAWADDPHSGTVGAPDCYEDGTRIQLDLDVQDSFRIPSAETPLSWCGALLGP